MKKLSLLNLKSAQLKNLLKKQWFTLVELIVVIAIIAVLAVSAFMMLTKWLSHSRDSRRLADLDTIHKSLEIWLIDLDNTTYVVPIPDEHREVTMNGTIWYQGVVGTWVVEKVHSLVKVPIDPNGQDYVYSIMKSNQRIYQVATVLEQDTARLINGVLATDWINRVEWSFQPALYQTDLDDGSCWVVYLPSIVVADWVSDIDPVLDQQYFVLDGESNNLLYGWTTMSNYSDIIWVDNNIDIVWSGTCGEDFDDATLDEIVAALDNMIPLEDGDTLDRTLVTELLNKGGTSGITTSQTPIPNTPANWVTVGTDGDTNTSEFQGAVNIDPATDESNITHYVVYWANSSDTKIGSAITTIAKWDNPIVYNIIENTSTPIGAEKILVTTKNSSGEMTSGVTGSFTDNTSGWAWPVPNNPATSASFTDTDINGGEIWGTIVISAASTDSDITDYVIYRGSNSTTKSWTAIATVSKWTIPLQYVLSADTAIPSGVTHILVYSKNANGENTTAVSIAITDDSSGDWGSGYFSSPTRHILPDTTPSSGALYLASGNFSLDWNYAVAWANGANGNEWAAYIFEKQWDWSWIELQELIPASHTPGCESHFGSSTDIDGDYAIVWAKRDCDNGIGAGAIYIFEKQWDWSWIELQKIYGSDIWSNARFWDLHSISIDWNYIVGWSAKVDDLNWAAYIFEKQWDWSWSEIQKIVSDDILIKSFWGHVDLDGNYMAISASDYLYIYEKQLDWSWSQIQKTEDTNFLIYDIAMDGNHIIVWWMPYDDSDFKWVARIFEKQWDWSWSETPSIYNSDNAANHYFWKNVWISGNYIIAWANITWAAYIFEKQLDWSWSQIQKITKDPMEVSFWGWLDIDWDTVIISSRAFRKLYFIK